MRGYPKSLWAGVTALTLLLGPMTGLSGPAAGAAFAAEKPFIHPVVAEVVREFEAPAHRFGAGHRGLDYGVRPGTPVMASGAGTVSFAGPVAGDGLFITIQHGRGISTTYSYLSRVDVSRTDQVAQGQVIGASGQGHPGESPGLHFGAKLNGEYIDPRLLLGDFDDITELLQLTPQLRAAHPPDGSVAFRNVSPGDASGGTLVGPAGGGGSAASVPAGAAAGAGPGDYPTGHSGYFERGSEEPKKFFPI